MTLLLLDNRFTNLSLLLRGLKSNVTLVLFDFERDTFETITEKIPEKGYTHLGILKLPSRHFVSDWIMESTGEDVEKVYFSTNIELYRHLLDEQDYKIDETPIEK
jgi:hypothetical protein